MSYLLLRPARRTLRSSLLGLRPSLGLGDEPTATSIAATSAASAASNAQLAAYAKQVLSVVRASVPGATLTRLPGEPNAYNTVGTDMGYLIQIGSYQGSITVTQMQSTTAAALAQQLLSNASTNYGGTSSTSTAASLSLSNLSRPGQASFQVGDQWEISITGATANAAVTGTATQNGQSRGTTSFGSTDSSGNFSLQGSMSAAEIGNWVEAWQVGGQQVGSTLSFIVISISAGTSTGAAAVTTGSLSFSNLSRPGQAFQVGDQWVISITGAQPNAVVTGSATQNSRSMGSTSYGSTDANGNFSLQGSMSVTEIGNWLEVWQVGGKQVGSSLSFSVAAAPLATATATTTTLPAPAQTNYTSPAAATSPAAGAGSVSLSNLSQPGSTLFNVGDQWWISITGAQPNAPVTASAMLNGLSLGSTSYGSTDANGNFSAQGSMSAGQVGNWTETWMVNGYQVGPTLSFSVAAVYDTGTSSPDVGQIFYPNAMPVTATPSFLTGQWITGIPNWALLGAGVAAYFMFKRS